MFAVFSHLISLVFIKDRPVSSFWVLPFRVLGASFSRFGCFLFDLGVFVFEFLGASFSRFGCFVFEFRVLRFRDLGASFSSFGCFVLRSSFSSASFSKLPTRVTLSKKGPKLFDTAKFFSNVM